MSFEHLVLTYGYPILFLGVLIEGEAFLLVGAYLAHKGYFSMPIVIGMAALATTLVSQIYFYIGQHYGQQFIHKRPTWQPRFQRVQQLLTRYGALLIVGFRALYGLRIVIPAVVGASGYGWLGFLLLNGLGGVIWALLLGLVGNQLVQLIEPVLADIRHHERLLVGILVGLGLVWGAYRHYRQPRLIQQAIEEE
ncbi:DedA family protein [Spirosoma lituiforme]|jgi:membrane protein DedA with SNARE-associated domain